MYVSDEKVLPCTVIEILSQLCKASEEELVAICGKTFINEIETKIMNAPEKKIIRLKSNNEAVGIFGLTDVGNKTGGIFLLTTENLHKGNIVTFLKSARKQIAQWERGYSLLLDNCYKKNEKIKKWLRLLGFNLSQFQDDKFQIYYKGDLSLYQ